MEEELLLDEEVLDEKLRAGKIIYTDRIKINKLNLTSSPNQDYIENKLPKKIDDLLATSSPYNDAVPHSQGIYIYKVPNINEILKSTVNTYSAPNKNANWYLNVSASLYYIGIASDLYNRFNSHIPSKPKQLIDQYINNLLTIDEPPTIDYYFWELNISEAELKETRHIEEKLIDLLRPIINNFKKIDIVDDAFEYLKEHFDLKSENATALVKSWKKCRELITTGTKGYIEEWMIKQYNTRILDRDNIGLNIAKGAPLYSKDDADDDEDNQQLAKFLQYSCLKYLSSTELHRKLPIKLIIDTLKVSQSTLSHWWTNTSRVMDLLMFTTITNMPGWTYFEKSPSSTGKSIYALTNLQSKKTDLVSENDLVQYLFKHGIDHKLIKGIKTSKPLEITLDTSEKCRIERYDMGDYVPRVETEDKPVLAVPSSHNMTKYVIKFENLNEIWDFCVFLSQYSAAKREVRTTREAYSDILAILRSNDRTTSQKSYHWWYEDISPILDNYIIIPLSEFKEKYDEIYDGRNANGNMETYFAEPDDDGQSKMLVKFDSLEDAALKCQEANLTPVKNTENIKRSIRGVVNKKTGSLYGLKWYSIDGRPTDEEYKQVEMTTFLNYLNILSKVYACKKNSNSDTLIVFDSLDQAVEYRNDLNIKSKMNNYDLKSAISKVLDGKKETAVGFNWYRYNNLPSDKKPLDIDTYIKGLNNTKEPVQESYYNNLNLTRALENKDECIKLISYNYAYAGPIETGGFYIMPDGTAVKSVNHADIDKFLIANKYITGTIEDYGDGSQFMDAINCVRIRRRGGKDSWILPYIIIPERPLTQEQINVLDKWITFVLDKSGELCLQSMNGDSKNYYAKDGYTAEDILDDIRYFYRYRILEDYELLYDPNDYSSKAEFESDLDKGYFDSFDD